MDIKKCGFDASTLTVFDLLGYKEKGIAHAFAYLLSKNKKALYLFLKNVGVKARNSNSNYLNTSISVEHYHDVGRTDIEIYQDDLFHVIIECKVRNNKVRQQRKKYLTAFRDTTQKILCFVTQVNDYNKATTDGVSVCNIGWIEIVNLFDGDKDMADELSMAFLKYAKRGYKMRNQKEILTQDVSDNVELTNFTENQIYRRDVVFGSPLYFAPYFTRNAETNDGVGISYISRILGILTMKTADLENYNDDLLDFANGERALVKKWKDGVKRYKKCTIENTYFFLGSPVKLKAPLKKDGGIKKGRGKNWIAAKITRNRCVSFEEFAKRIIMTQATTSPAKKTVAPKAATKAKKLSVKKPGSKKTIKKPATKVVAMKKVNATSHKSSTPAVKGSKTFATSVSKPHGKGKKTLGILMETYYDR